MNLPQSIYLACRWSRREEVLGYANELKALEIETTSRWLTDPEHRLSADGDGQAFNTKLAGHDVEDVTKAQALVYFAPGGTRGGSHVEFGMALAQRKRLFWIGEREHVFSFMPQVNVFATWPEFVAYLRGMQDANSIEYAVAPEGPRLRR